MEFKYQRSIIQNFPDLEREHKSKGEAPTKISQKTSQKQDSLPKRGNTDHDPSPLMTMLGET